MKWLLKASFQKALSPLPQSHTLNYLFQQRVTRSLPASDAAFRRKVEIALEHFHAYEEAGGAESSETVFYEFGSGWDLVVPLAYHSLGVERQILVDIRPNLRFELIRDSLRKYERHHAELERAAGRPLRRLDSAPVASVADLKTRFGIDYLAPRDARNTGLPAESVDFVSSTLTLEHVPALDIPPILAECNRLLKRRGVMSSRIDMQDHYSYFDKTISRYNYLRFAERRWALVNSGLHYQNRLRYPDYITLFEQAGFEIVAERLSRPTRKDLQQLESIELAPQFSRYSRDELAVRGLALVARKREPT